MIGSISTKVEISENYRGILGEYNKGLSCRTAGKPLCSRLGGPPVGLPGSSPPFPARRRPVLQVVGVLYRFFIGVQRASRPAALGVGFRGGEFRHIPGLFHGFILQMAFRVSSPPFEGPFGGRCACRRKKALPNSICCRRYHILCRMGGCKAFSPCGGDSFTENQNFSQKNKNQNGIILTI